MSLPRFVTFTGADDKTSIAGMHILASQYPIEWGVLFSPKHQGHGGRYPSLEVVQALVRNKGTLRLSAHLCGAHSRTVIEKRQLEQPVRGLVSMFDRVQVNTSMPVLPIRELAAWGGARNQRVILQCRAEFPSAVTEVDWLFDASGGRGVEPVKWPAPASFWHARNVFKGYAGGLNPGNVAKHVAAIWAKADECYWIDMESGVRDENDAFSLDKCRAVCEALWGKG